MLKLETPIRLLVTLGYNANIGMDRIVELQGLWLCFEFLTHKILFFLIDFLLVTLELKFQWKVLRREIFYLKI
jgi:hypothetical protein